MASIEKVYARALMDSVDGKNNLSKVLGELEDFYALCRGRAELFTTLLRNNVSSEKRESIVTALTEKMKSGKGAQKFLQTLARRGRLAVLPIIIKTVYEFMDEAQGIARGKIRSAVPLPQSELHEIEITIGKQVGKKIELHQTEDAELLGGIIVQVAGKTFDASLRTPLNKLRTQLAQ